MGGVGDGMSGLSTRAFLGELKAERERLGREIAARRLALDPDPAARLARRRRLLVPAKASKRFPPRKPALNPTR